jgi:hypothetical protein
MIIALFGFLGTYQFVAPAPIWNISIGTGSTKDANDGKFTK